MVHLRVEKLFFEWKLARKTLSNYALGKSEKTVLIVSERLESCTVNLRFQPTSKNIYYKLYSVSDLYALINFCYCTFLYKNAYSEGLSCAFWVSRRFENVPIFSLTTRFYKSKLTSIRIQIVQVYIKVTDSWGLSQGWF